MVLLTISAGVNPICNVSYHEAYNMVSSLMEYDLVISEGSIEEERESGVVYHLFYSRRHFTEIAGGSVASSSFMTNAASVVSLSAVYIVSHWFYYIISRISVILVHSTS